MLQCQVLTPPGAGAVGVVRVCGASAWPAVAARVNLPAAPTTGRLYYGRFVDAADTVDDVIVAPVAEGADSAIAGVDICCHGGVRVIERILLALAAGGAQVVGAAEPVGHAPSGPIGLIERIDRCLIQATTHRGAKCLLAQRHLLPAAIMDVLALVERDAWPAARRRLTELLAIAPGAHRLYDPAEVVLVGPPNAGKSQLANYLAGRDAAVVCARSGTTRDWVSLPAAVGGVPLTLVDTAGVRDTTDSLEDAAIRAGRQRSATADVFLLVVDGASPPEAISLAEWCGRCPANRTLIVANKSDLGPARGELGNGALPHPVVVVSAQTGEGISSLSRALLRLLAVPDEEAGRTRPMVVDSVTRAALTALVADKHATLAARAECLRCMLSGL